MGTIAALGLTTGVAPAVAADAGTWRIAYAGNRPTGYDQLNTVVATGPADAWAFGGTASADGRAPGARHWNGRSWSETALPAGLGHTITTAGATGPRNVWAFAGGDEEGDSYAIRWDGRRWKVAQRWPGGTIVSDSAVLSARDVWVFGSAHVAPSVGTWHYDGRSWQRFETPFGDLSSASAVASDDIWAVGSDNFGIDNVVARWDGHAWTQLEVPGLPNEENHFPELRGIYAASPQDVWIVGDEYQSDGDDSSRTPLALHFDGAHLAAARRTGRPG